MASKAKRGGKEKAEAPEEKIEVPRAKSVSMRPLSDLLLDATNPRFGGTLDKAATQETVLNTIVNKFGVDDLLSSLSVNGYFDSEPLVGYTSEKGSKIVIAEGNRRLAACLILEGDPRAKEQKSRQQAFDFKERVKISAVPVLIYPNKSDLLNFMGVRHIAAQNPWDSYAKVHWVAEMLEQGNFSLSEISKMIGDQHGTVARMLEGYYFANQLTQKGLFSPKDSTRPGRGSNPDYPFSWVYTALGYAGLREWLGLSGKGEPEPNPIPDNKLENAAELMRLMFGHKTKGQVPVIADSREIADLAGAVSDPKQIGSLRNGVPLAKAAKEKYGPDRRVEDGLFEAKESLKEVTTVLAAQKIDAGAAGRLKPLSKEVRNLAVDIDKKLLAAQDDSDDNE